MGRAAIAATSARSAAALLQTVAFVPPDLPVLPERLDSDAHAIRAPPGEDVLPAYPAQPNPARAPPLAV